MLDAHQLLWTQIAAGACTLTFAGFLFNMFRMRNRMQAAGNWDKIEGVITVSKVDQPPTHVSDDLNDATPIIRYRYRAGGQEIEGDQISVGGAPLTTRVLALRMVARYPVGARVDVHVDPNDAKNALLDPNNQGNLAALIAFTIVFGLVAAVLVAHSIAGHVLYTSKGAPLFVFPLPILTLLGAVFGVVAFVRGRQLASASARWPTAAGVITTSDVIEEAIEEKDNDDKSRIRKIYRYQVDLRYAYQVGKRDFVGTAANWGATAIYGLRELGEKAASQYRQGQPVTVYYDPEQPGNAVLEPDSRQGSLAPLIAAAVCAVFGGVMLAVFVFVGFGG
jgi:Protein of unknown function (DUF3592)